MTHVEELYAVKPWSKQIHIPFGNKGEPWTSLSSGALNKLYLEHLKCESNSIGKKLTEKYIQKCTQVLQNTIYRHKKAKKLNS